MLVKPKKQIGQHFLHDKNIAQKIVSSIKGAPSKVIEIGPGTGVLTQYLAPSYPNLLVIEIDSESINYLIDHKIIDSEKIIHGDFLKLNLQPILESNSCIIGNFPYYISSQIFFRILENRQYISEVVCMIQHEVAERIAASAGNKTYGILSVLLQTFYHVEYLFKVKPHVFIPPPKVDSAVVRLTRNQLTSLPCNEELYFTIIKTAFNQRRKMLRNSLKNFFTNEQLNQVIFDRRPEQLSVEEFISLTQMAK